MESQFGGGASLFSAGSLQPRPRLRQWNVDMLVAEITSYTRFLLGKGVLWHMGHSGTSAIPPSDPRPWAPESHCAGMTGAQWEVSGMSLKLIP